MSEEFKSHVKKWLEYDNDIKKRYESIRELENKRKKYETAILKYMIRNNMSDSVINFGHGKLRCDQVKRPEYISKKYLENTLAELFNDPEKSKQIVNYIYKNREVTVVPKLKII